MCCLFHAKAKREAVAGTNGHHTPLVNGSAASEFKMVTERAVMRRLVTQNVLIHSLRMH